MLWTILKDKAVPLHVKGAFLTIVSLIVLAAVNSLHANP